MQDEYNLELRDLEQAPPRPPGPPSPTELDQAADKMHAKVVIETENPQWWWTGGCSAATLALFRKLKGGQDKRLPIPPLREIIWSFIGAFLGILSVSVLNQWLSPEINLPLLVGSFGASAVLIFAVVESKLSQPRNFIGGQVISAIVGVIVRLIIHVTWVAEPVGMSLSLVAMLLTSTTHPPGGATALIICSSPIIPKWAGFSYVVTVLFGSLMMQIVALVVNNLNPSRQYPTFWY